MSEISNTTTSTGGFTMPKIKGSVIIIGLYLLFLRLPIYWLLTMSLKSSFWSSASNGGYLREAR